MKAACRSRFGVSHGRSRFGVASLFRLVVLLQVWLFEAAIYDYGGVELAAELLMFRRAGMYAPQDAPAKT